MNKLRKNNKHETKSHVLPTRVTEKLDLFSK